MDGEVRTNDHKYGAISSALLTPSANNTVDKMNVPYTDLKFIKEIGSGAYGKVFIGGESQLLRLNRSMLLTRVTLTEWQRTKVALKINTLASGDEFAREAKLMV